MIVEIDNRADYEWTEEFRTGETPGELTWIVPETFVLASEHPVHTPAL